MGFFSADRTAEGGADDPTEMLCCSVAANPGVEAGVGGRTDTHEVVDYDNKSLARKSILVGIKGIYLARFEDSLMHLRHDVRDT